jgi:hypothetical protein
MSQIDDIKFAIKLNSIAVDLGYYTILIVTNLGLITNTLNIIISMRKPIQQSSMGFYNIIMSIFNILSLIASYITIFPQIVSTTNLNLLSTFSCISIAYFQRVVIHMSSWINVMISADRMLCVTFPSRFKFVNDKRILSLIALGLLIFVSTINAANFWFFLKEQTIFDTTTNKTLVTSQGCTSDPHTLFIRDTISVIVRIMLPVILEAIFNSILIYKLFQSRKRASQMTMSNKKEYKFSITIVMLNFAFLLFLMPTFVTTIYLNIIKTSSASYRSQVIALFAYNCSLVFAIYQFGSIFFINLFFNKIFQKEIRLILCGFRSTQAHQSSRRLES